jgi:hypothetical protein
LDVGATPATTALLQRDRLLSFFNDFFKACVAAQRIPPQHQFQLTVAERIRVTDGKLFAGEFFSPTHAAVIAKYLMMAGPFSIEELSRRTSGNF